MEIQGIGAFLSTMEKFSDNFEDKIVQTRREVTEFLIEALLQRTPVWSGDTAGSYFVSASGGGSSGRKHNHKPFETGTNSMSLGRKQEKYAKAAWSKSQASAKGVDYRLSKQIVIGNDSDIWKEVDAGQLPLGRPRNTGGISDIAIMRTRNKFKKVLE